VRAFFAQNGVRGVRFTQIRNNALFDVLIDLSHDRTVVFASNCESVALITSVVAAFGDESNELRESKRMH
jgi:hypothetical protein